MMRKFNKKKSGRRGAILVTVVFVLAFATIFIAAAMTLTQATRKRVYTEAYKDQARLTVTSVAEAWYRAVKMCEFDDSAIVALCEGAGKTIHVTAPTDADRIPGLEVGSENNPDNCTIAFFHRDHTGTGTADKDYTYYVDFTTTIGGHKENVRSVLTYNPPDKDESGMPFSAQFDINNELDQLNMNNVGDGVNNESNIFLARQGGKNRNGDGWTVYSTMVYCDGYVAFKADSFYSEDMVFLTGAKFKHLQDATHPDHMDTKYFFFFGTDGEPIAEGDSGDWTAKAGQTFYLCNRTNSGNWSGGAKIEYVTEDGRRTSDTKESTLPVNIQNKIKAYASYNSSYSAGGKGAFPTTKKFLTGAGKLKIYETAAEVPHYDDVVTEISLGNYVKQNCYQLTTNTDKFAKSGTFLFTSDGSNHDDQHPEKYVHNAGEEPKQFESKEPYVIVLNGEKDYKFYFKAGKSFSLRNIIFIVAKPSVSHPVVFVLEKGANIYWAGNGNTGDDWKSNMCAGTYVGGNGIISVIDSTNRKMENAKAAFDYLMGEEGEWTQKHEGDAYEYFDKKHKKIGSKGWSKAYNGTNECAAYVIGMGENKFCISKSMVIEAFVGLFNDSYKNGSPKSWFNTYNDKKNLLYGRLMTDGYKDADGGGITMPASHDSSNMKDIDTGFEKAKTYFKLVKMVYYYNLTSGKTNPSTGG